VRVGVIVGVIASILQLYPTGDGQGVMIARYQPVTLAAMEGLFHTERGALSRFSDSLTWRISVWIIR